MKTEGSIRMDYSAMLRKASSLEDLAEQLLKAADSVDRLRGGAASAWTGKASTEYCKKLSKERDLIRRRAKQLSQGAEGVRKAAKRIYDAEMYALSLFGRR